MDRFAGIFQYAYFVEDLARSAEHFAKTVGAGPFFIAPHHKTDRFEYRGKPVEADVSYAFAYAGNCQIQLIQQHDHQPSIYRDMFNEGEFGLHHIARLEADYGVPNRNWTDRDLRKRVNCMPMVCGLAITTRVRVFIVLLKFTQSPIEF